MGVEGDDDEILEQVVDFEQIKSNFASYCAPYCRKEYALSDSEIFDLISKNNNLHYNIWGGMRR